MDDAGEDQPNRLCHWLSVRRAADHNVDTGTLSFMEKFFNNPDQILVLINCHFFVKRMTLIFLNVKMSQ